MAQIYIYPSYQKYVKYRDNLHLKDADVSNDTGVSRSTFSDWAAGKSNPKLDKLVKIAKRLDVTIEDLITEYSKE